MLMSGIHSKTVIILWNIIYSSLNLCRGISDDNPHWWRENLINFFVIIIAFSNNHIAFFNKFDNVSHAMTATKLAKKCAARLEFLLCLFSRFCHSRSCPEPTSHVSGIIMKTFSWSPSKLWFPFKNQPSDGKHASNLHLQVNPESYRGFFTRSTWVC